MGNQIRLRSLWGMCVVLAFTFCAPAQDVPVENGGDYDDLVQLFQEFRELQETKMTDWVPDYTPATMAEQRRGLMEFQKRLKANDISDWPIDKKVEYHLVRA